MLLGRGGDQGMPAWYTVLTLAYAVPATALGGYLRAWQRRRSPAKELIA
jgi:hypothetical protein